MNSPGRSDITAALSTLWCEILDRPAVGLDDNFFDLGGDSMLAVRLSARARQCQLQLRSADVYKHQTIAKLARIIDPLARHTTGNAGVSSGPSELLPSQRRWLEGEIPEIDYFNLDVLLTCPAELRRREMETVARTLLLRHEALRTRYRRVSGEWAAERVPVTDALVAGAVEEIALADVEGANAAERLARALERYHRSLSLADGRIFRLVRIDLDDRRARLFVLVHHLTADGVSMSVLLDELEHAAVAAIGGHQPNELAQATAPSAYARALAGWRTSQEAQAAARAWLALPWAWVGTVGVDHEHGPGRLPTWKTVVGQLTEKESQVFTAGLADRMPAQNAVLGSLLGAIAQWSGTATHLFDVYGHNRDAAPDGLDLSGTVGYVQSTYPAILSWHGKRSELAALQSVHEQMESLPNPRHSFDSLRFSAGPNEDYARLRKLPAASLRCNFRGHLARVIERKTSLFQEAPEPTVRNRSPLQVERYRLLTEGDLVDGKLMIGIRYSGDFYQRETAQALVGEALRILRAASAKL